MLLAAQSQFQMQNQSPAVTGPHGRRQAGLGRRRATRAFAQSAEETGLCEGQQEEEEETGRHAGLSGPVHLQAPRMTAAEAEEGLGSCEALGEEHAPSAWMAPVFCTYAPHRRALCKQVPLGNPRVTQTTTV